MDNKQALYNELKRLSKRANQRILRLERLTKLKEPFDVKQLMDYLSAEPVKGRTKGGRVSVSMSMTENQMIAIIKATKEFLSEDLSKVSNVKKEKARIDRELGKKISYKSISTMYTSKQLWKWINEVFGSEFWKDFAPMALRQSQNDWVEMCAKYIDKINDTTVINKLKLVYNELTKNK